jgi:hypothetical protein
MLIDKQTRCGTTLRRNFKEGSITWDHIPENAEKQKHTDSDRKTVRRARDSCCLDEREC